MKKIFLLCALCAFLNADTGYKELEKTDGYTIYCVDNYKWIYWNKSYAFPIQIFEYHNGQSVPVRCK